MKAQGVDVSVYQTLTPDLSGLSFLFARASIGIAQDARYTQHVANAIKDGLIVGAYHFALGNLPIKAQVAAFLSAATGAEMYAVDVEGDNAPSHAQTAEFIARVQATGRRIGLYHSDSGYFDAGQDWNWIANWSATPSHKWDFHQYRGSPLDLDRFRGDEDALRAFVAPVPDTGVDTMRTYKLSPGPCGTITAMPGHDALRLDDGVLVDVPAGMTAHGHPAVLDEPITASPTTMDRRVGYLYGIAPYGPHFLLKTDVTFNPDTDCTAAILADRQRAHIVYS